MKLGGNFSCFCKEDLFKGDAHLTDPIGNVSCLQLSDDASGNAVFSSGVLKLGTFYQLETVHEV